MKNVLAWIALTLVSFQINLCSAPEDHHLITVICFKEEANSASNKSTQDNDDSNADDNSPDDNSSFHTTKLPRWY